MKKHVGMLTLAAIVVLLLLTMTVTFTSGSDELVLVQTLGETTRVFNGHADAGLHFKWPWPFERIVRYDARKQVFQDTLDQMQIKDGNITVTTYCAWRIEPGHPELFQQKLGAMKTAEERIRSQLRAEKQNVLSQHVMADLVNTDSGSIRLEAIENEIRKRIAAQYSPDKYGVEIVAVGICELGVTQDVSKQIIENMRSRVGEQIEAYEGSGKADAEAIRSRARQAKELILAFADYRAKLTESEVQRYFAKIQSEFKEDNELAGFVRRIRFMKSGVLSNSTIIMDTDVFSRPPEWLYSRPQGGQGKAGNSAGASKDEK